ncbi:LamG-like jellyroll fold domain-containing protein [Flavilitoribacter nigricans]|uniref:T9SS type B sorting domain-containing protein n=1 Tax=Flavilitoribacter nigricans (strain ATCC 23147 / DSM 23189 / NBRC 102662 / NCIMB 1420 / SS-2) TaxID=1122177 RepID=A0A2D0N3L4_FLAN2|nr:LamG-like jellyroll fold domain-containing protein [Flavilitoribacter nigricans]PHN03094.1 hypothetical protein CRP01_28870 [Flavilitoribacter nigricans DSM 23189 = NBRC 102662]
MSLIRVLSLLICLWLAIPSGYSQFEKVLVLNGCTDYAEIPDHYLGILDDHYFTTIECWILPNCIDGEQAIFSKQWCNGEFGYSLSVNEGKLRWVYSLDGSCNLLSIHETVDKVIPSNEFTHVAIRHLPNSTEMVINGKTISSVQLQGEYGQIKDSAEPLRIGAYREEDGSINRYFSGLIDELRFWSAAHLDTTLQKYMNMPIEGNENGLLLYLDMEEEGKGPGMPLHNHSSLGKEQDGMAVGGTANTPYTSTYADYLKNPVDLGADRAICDGTVTFALDYENYKSVLWSTGVMSNSIEVSSFGTYSVLAERERCRFFSDTVAVGPAEYAYRFADYTICPDGAVVFNNRTYSNEGTYRDTLASVMGCDTIYEFAVSFYPPLTAAVELEACPAGTTRYQGEELAVGDTASFLLTSSRGCDSVVTVTVVPRSTIREELVISACEGVPAVFDGMPLLPGTRTEFAYVTPAGCDSIVGVSVELALPMTGFLGVDRVTCAQSFILSGPGEQTVWNDGTRAQQITIGTSGVYIAEYTDPAGCIHRDSVNVTFADKTVYVPNAFSPNEDGINDCFQPQFSNAVTVENYKLLIYDRYGALVYQTSDPDDCWDGRYRGETIRGVVVWMIRGVRAECEENEVLMGDLAVLP